jgi:hypothetical protein
VRPDTANRNFAGLLAASGALLWVLCGAAACVLLTLVAVRLGDDGLGALSGSDHDVWPALAFLAIVAVGTGLGVRSLILQLRSSRELDSRMRAIRLPAPPALQRAAQATRLGDHVTLVDALESFSFTYGALHPRVVVSRGLCDQASAEELRAVLEHEAYHVRNLDPLKVLLARSLPATFFYLPVLRDLRGRYVAGRELAADRRAVEACGRTSLAGALVKVVSAPRWPELRAAAAIGGADLLDVRITQLESGREPPAARVTFRAVALSAVGLAVLTGAFVASVVAYGGPSAIEQATGVDLRPLNVLLGLLCAVPWVIGGWIAFRWLRGRARPHS